jgi:hypothetical protein
VLNEIFTSVFFNQVHGVGFCQLHSVNRILDSLLFGFFLLGYDIFLSLE